MTTKETPRKVETPKAKPKRAAKPAAPEAVSVVKPDAGFFDEGKEEGVFDGW